MHDHIGQLEARLEQTQAVHAGLSEHLASACASKDIAEQECKVLREQADRQACDLRTQVRAHCDRASVLHGNRAGIVRKPSGDKPVPTRQHGPAATSDMQVTQLEARLEASHTMVRSLSQANNATTAALQETRELHAAELERLAHAQDTLAAAATREAVAAEAGPQRRELADARAQLHAALDRISALETELKVGTRCWMCPWWWW